MSLEMAILHKEALVRARASHAHDPRLRWYHSNFATLESEINKDTWGKVQMVSVGPAGLLGYLSATIDRSNNLVSALAAVRFTERLSLEYGRDMFRFFGILFGHYGFHAVQWSVVVGSPHERTYDLLAAKLGGRVVGRWTGDAVLADGSRHDRKLYELVAARLDRQALDRLAGGRRAERAQSDGSGRPRAGDAPAGERGGDGARERGRAGRRAGVLRPGLGRALGGVDDGGGGAEQQQAQAVTGELIGQNLGERMWGVPAGTMQPRPRKRAGSS